MSADEFTEVTNTSWGSRIGGSIKGILFGVILILASIAGLFWNEGRAVQTAKSLSEGASVVVSAPADKVDQANQGKLVHISGTATSTETLRDDSFTVSAQALLLQRQTETYQWEERKHTKTEKKIGGGEVTKTTYSYHKVWSPGRIDSGSFKRSQGHQNPGSLPYPSRDFIARQAKVGAFSLTPAQVKEIDVFEPLSLGPDYAPPAGLSGRATANESGIYIGRDPGDPQIGDIRVSFRVVRPQTVSLIGQQQGGGLVPYQTEAGDKLMMVEPGAHPASAMFKQAESANRVLTWILRLVGFLVMGFGFSLILRPISVVLDVLPFLGNIAGAGLGLVAGVISLFISLVVIAIAWLYYRPLLGIILLVAAVGLIVGFKLLRSRKAPAPRAAPAVAGAAPPPPAMAPGTPPPPPTPPTPPPPPPES